MKKITSVEEYLEVHTTWTDALNLIRDLITSTELKKP